MDANRCYEESRDTIAVVVVNVVRLFKGKSSGMESWVLVMATQCGAAAWTTVRGAE